MLTTTWGSVEGSRREGGKRTKGAAEEDRGNYRGLEVYGGGQNSQETSPAPDVRPAVQGHGLVRAAAVPAALSG